MYSQIWRILHVPAGITSSMVRPVLFQRAAADGVASVELTTQIAFRWMLLLGAPWVALGIWSHQELTPMVLGAKWASAAIYVPALIIPAFLFALVNWIDRLLDVARRQDINLFTESAATFTSVGVLGLSLYAGMTPGRAAILQGIVLASAYIGFAFIAFNVLSYSVARLGQSLLGGLLIGLVTISTCVIAAILNFPHAGVAIGGLIFAISMVVVLRLMRVNR